MASQIIAKKLVMEGVLKHHMEFIQDIFSWRISSSQANHSGPYMRNSNMFWLISMTIMKNRKKKMSARSWNSSMSLYWVHPLMTLTSTNPHYPNNSPRKGWEINQISDWIEFFWRKKWKLVYQLKLYDQIQK